MVAVIAIICAAGCYLAWKYFASVDAALSPPPMHAGSAGAATAANASNSKPMSIVEGLTVDTRTSATHAGFTARSGAESSLFDTPIRSLIHSDSLAKMDYALFRMELLCKSVSYNSNGVKMIEEHLSAAAIRGFGEGALNFGRATDAMRSAAYARSIAKCLKLHESGLLSQQERDAFNARPEGKTYRALTQTLFPHDAPTDFGTPAAKVAIEKAVAEPMFGVLYRLLLSHVEYESLSRAYAGSVLPSSWPDIVSTLVLCRMGDDCGQGGLVTEQLCWQHAICGANAEDAVIANMVERGIDVTALNATVTRVHRALQAGDTSIFRKPGK
jgi:hypothetical protein